MAHLLKLLVAFVASLTLAAAAAAPASAGQVLVTPSISGAGTIAGGPSGCTRSGVPNGTITFCALASAGIPSPQIPGVMQLTATPNGNGSFSSWVGCPNPSGNVCTLIDVSAGVSNWTPRAIFTDSVGPSLGAPTAVLSSVVDRTVTVSWTPNETLSAAECRIDTVVITACSGLTAHTVTLAEGQHSLQVRGTDINGNVGALTPAVSFRIIDTALPGAPAAHSNDKNPTFTYATLTGVTFDCSLDGAAFAPCGTKGGDNRASTQLTNLADGAHTFRVRARDGGEFDRVPVVYTWTVDTVAPTTTLGASGPGEGALQAVNRETFVFSSSEDGTFECQLDGAGFAPCASGITLEGLSASAHRFEVRAVDAAGNVGAAVARSWVVFAFPAGGTPTPQGSTAPEQIVVTLAFFAKASKRTTKFTTLQVKNVPLDATVKVTCAGKGCPSGLKGKGFTKAKAFGTVTLAKFIKKPLKAGDKITVTVSKPNAIAAVKVLTVRASKKPLIATKCVPPGAAKPVAC